MRCAQSKLLKINWWLHDLEVKAQFARTGKYRYCENKGFGWSEKCLGGGEWRICSDGWGLEVKSVELWAGYEHLFSCCMKTSLLLLKNPALIHRKTVLGMYASEERLQVVRVLRAFSVLTSLAPNVHNCNSSVLHFSRFFFNCSQNKEHTSTALYFFPLMR